MIADYRVCQTDTRWLSSPKTKEGNEIQLVLEQMYEDLNSYSETSVMLDGINSLELSLFPFYRELRFASISYSSANALFDPNAASKSAGG